MSDARALIPLVDLLQQKQVDPAAVERLVASVPDGDLSDFEALWPFWSRGGQNEPPGDWMVWLMMAGRGYGKTRGGAGWLVERVLDHGAGTYVALVGATAADARAVMVEGPSGILAVSSDRDRPIWEPSLGRLIWPSGAQGWVYSAESGDRLRGPQFHFAWCDEVAAWPDDIAWTNLRMALRVGVRPRLVATTTPRGTAFMRKLKVAPGTVATGGRTADNPNTSAVFRDAMAAEYAGTRLGRQELDGELIEDAHGALWTRDLIEACRVRTAPELVRVVIGVDPPAGRLSGAQGDACGIIVCGLGRDGVSYVIADDLGAFVGDKRAPSIDLAIEPVEATSVSLSIAYLDPARDYQAGMQRARREGGGVREGRIDLPAVLDADAANHAVYAALSRIGVERTRASITVPWRAMTLRPGDVIAVGGTAWRIAVVQFEHMVVRLDLVRTADTTLPEVIVAPGRNTGEIDAVHGPTTLVVVDLPPLTDQAATRPMVTVFANGVSPGWRRAALLASVDGGVSYVPAGSTALSATMGSTVTILPPASSALIDRINTVDVDLLNNAMVLSEADEPSLLSGANLAMIDDELIQFGRAVPVAPGRWRLSALWRGRRGTEDAVITHPAGSRFVLVEQATGFVLPAELAVAGTTIMASGIGDVVPYPTATCSTALQAVAPLSPTALTASALSGGDTELRWIRRSREGWAWRDGVDVPIAEEREAYRIDWEGGAAESVESRFVYTAAMRAEDITAGRVTVTFAVRQIGRAALSPPVAITIDIS